MNSLVFKTALKLLSIFSILTACTFIYSIFEDKPPKIIGFFITTFIFSLLGGILILLIGRLANNSRQSFINNPHKVILTLVIVISLSRIIGVFSAQQLASANNEPVEQVSIERFVNDVYGVSFKYPISWVPRTPQRQSTLILLYETLGTQATCNLSVIAQDQKEIRNYSADYFKNILPKIYKTIDNVKTDFTNVNSKEISWTTYDFLLPTDTNGIPAKSITLTALNNGHRFMLVINFPEGNLELIEDDIKIITESLTFK